MFDSFIGSPILPNATSLTEWVRRQKTEVLSHIDVDVPLHERQLNYYNFMIKSTVKPQLDTNAPNVYSSLQTIAYHDKDINAYFCPIFNEIKHRLTKIIDPRFMLFCDLSPEQFADQLSARFDANVTQHLDKLEIDISKYEKSQGTIALKLECMLMRAFGVPDELISLWYDAHCRCLLVDRNNGVRFTVMNQRKSGDASTYMGITMFLMGVIATLFDISQCQFALSSGDDSLIVGGDIDHDRNESCGLLFNLESKFFRNYSYMYFCSKFLLIIENKFFLCLIL